MCADSEYQGIATAMVRIPTPYDAELTDRLSVVPFTQRAVETIDGVDPGLCLYSYLDAARADGWTMDCPKYKVGDVVCIRGLDAPKMHTVIGIEFKADPSAYKFVPVYELDCGAWVSTELLCHVVCVDVCQGGAGSFMVTIKDGVAPYEVLVLVDGGILKSPGAGNDERLFLGSIGNNEPKKFLLDSMTSHAFSITTKDSVGCRVVLTGKVDREGKLKSVVKMRARAEEPYLALSCPCVYCVSPPMTGIDPSDL